MASNKHYFFREDGQDYAVVMECCICGKAGTTCSLTLFSPDQVRNVSMFVNCQLVELREANQYCFVCDCCKNMLSQCSRNIELMCITPLFIPEKIDYRCTFCKTPRSYKILSLPKDGIPYFICNNLLTGAPPDVIWICRACDEVLSDLIEIREIYLNTVSKKRSEDNLQTKNCPVKQEPPVSAEISVTSDMEQEELKRHEPSNVSVTCGVDQEERTGNEASEVNVYGGLFSPKAIFDNSTAYLPRAFLITDLELDNKEDSVLNKPGDLLIDLDMESKNLIMKDDGLVCGVDTVDLKLDNDSLVLNKPDISLTDQTENTVYGADLFSPKLIFNKTTSYIPRAFLLTDLELDNKEDSVLNKPEGLLIDLNMESKNLIRNDDPKLDNDSLILNKPDKSLTDKSENTVYGADLFAPKATFNKTTAYIPRAFLIIDLELDNKEDSVLKKPGDSLVDLDMESKNLIMKDDNLICGMDIVNPKLENDSLVLNKPDKSGDYLFSPKVTFNKTASYIPRACLITDLELGNKGDSVLNKPGNSSIDLDMESKNLIMKDDNLICGMDIADLKLENDSLVLNKPDKSLTDQYENTVYGADLFSPIATFDKMTSYIPRAFLITDLELGNKGDSVLNKPGDLLADLDMESKNLIMKDDNLICGADIVDPKLDNDSLVLYKPDKSGDDLFSPKVTFNKTASYIPRSLLITDLELDNKEDSVLNKFEKFGLDMPNKNKIIDGSNKVGDVHTSSPKIDNITVYMSGPMNTDFEFNKNNTRESNKSEELSFNQLGFDVASENTKTEVDKTLHSLDSFSPVKTVDYIDHLLSVTPGPFSRDKVYTADRPSSSRNFEDSMYYSSRDPWPDDLMTNESTLNSEDKIYISGYEKAEIIRNFQKSLMDELVVCSKDFASGDSSFDDSIDFEIDFLTHYMSKLSLGNDDSDYEEIENTEDTEHAEQKVHDETPEDILIEVSEVFTSISKIKEDKAI